MTAGGALRRGREPAPKGLSAGLGGPVKESIKCENLEREGAEGARRKIPN